jgi:hypothetical protein
MQHEYNFWFLFIHFILLNLILMSTLFPFGEICRYWYLNSFSQYLLRIKDFAQYWVIRFQALDQAKVERQERSCHEQTIIHCLNSGLELSTQILSNFLVFNWTTEIVEPNCLGKLQHLWERRNSLSFPKWIFRLKNYWIEFLEWF